jgi:hypothetical protein
MDQCVNCQHAARHAQRGVVTCIHPTRPHGTASYGWCQNHCPDRQPLDENRPALLQDCSPLAAAGPRLWRELHERKWTEFSRVENGRWLRNFHHRVNLMKGCNCWRGWLGILAKHIPPLVKPEGMERWGWEVHNAVNARLSKPPFSWEQFCRRYHRAGRNWEGYFGAVYCVTLAGDEERRKQFTEQAANCGWPFGTIEYFAAIHGDTVGVPDYFHQGGGAWGCLQSHRRILELSLMAGHERVLIMEDDVDLTPEFGAKAIRFLTDLGDEPWDCLMLGGQHMAAPSPFKPGVWRCGNTQRTHCLAFSRGFMRELYRHWSAPWDQHCDRSLGPFAGYYRTYCPPRFIAGQRGGRSWITGGSKPPEWWNPPPPDAPVVWLRCPRPVLEKCRDLFHAGNRRNAQGICVGLADVFDPLKNPPADGQIAALKGWISMIQWEVESRGDGSVCTIWHPAATAQIVATAAGKMLVEIEAATEQEAREAPLSRNAMP